MTRSKHVMEFERPLVELEEKLDQLQRLDLSDSPELVAEVEALAAQLEELRIKTYSDLTPWERVQIARHPDRPKTQHFIESLFTEVVELHGDRLEGDDEAIFAGLATFEGVACVVIGHRKGTNTRENVARNFGSPHPEGFRKSMRAMRLAEKFQLPVITFLDTAGAYPGIEAEERGQAWAIAESLELLSGLRTPVIAVGIGEGGSGGALAIGFGDRLIMLENAYYSVISPEMCATILYKDASYAAASADCLQLTAGKLVELGIADEIIAEPLGGAHRDPHLVYEGLRTALERDLVQLTGTDTDELVRERWERLRQIGVFTEGA